MWAAAGLCGGRDSARTIHLATVFVHTASEPVVLGDSREEVASICSRGLELVEDHLRPVFWHRPAQAYGREHHHLCGERHSLQQALGPQRFANLEVVAICCNGGWSCGDLPQLELPCGSHSAVREGLLGCTVGSAGLLVREWQRAVQWTRGLVTCDWLCTGLGSNVCGIGLMASF